MKKPVDRALMEMREALAQRIAAIAGGAGEYPTAISGLSLYYRTTPTACYRASYEPGLSIFVQGRKRIILGHTEYICDGSSFLLSSIDVPAQSQITEASEKTPLLSMFLTLDLPAVREVLSRDDVPEAELYRIVKGWPLARQLSDCWAHAFACLSFWIHRKTYRS